MQSEQLANENNPLSIDNYQHQISVKLLYAKEQQKLSNAELLRLEAEYLQKKSLMGIEDQRKFEEDLAKRKAELSQLNQSIIQMEYNKNAKIREGLYGVTSDIIIQGNSLRQIWGKLWNDLANDALKALFRVQNSAPGILSSILGLFGGVNLSGVRPAGVSGPLGSNGGFYAKTAHTGEFITGYAPKMHDGGMVQGSAWVPQLKNDEVLRTLQVGERVLSKGDNAAMEQHLATQTQLLSAMLQVLSSNNNNGNQAAIAQPIVMQQSMSMDELAGMLSKMKSYGYKF